MPPGAPNAATITVPETLALLDGTFASVARGVAEDRYVLWLGSGISFGRVAGLRQVIARVLEFLRARTIPGDPAIKLQSFIVSNTPSHTMRMLWHMEKADMQKRHILFQEEDKDTYVRSMLEAVCQ